MLHVLVCDDASDTRMMFAELLRLEGHVVVEADTGEAAVEVVLAGDIDVAFLDLGLPGISGHEVARRIRAAELPRRVRLIAITGYNTTKDLADSRAAGFDLHFAKPATREQLRAALATVRRRS